VKLGDKYQPVGVFGTGSDFGVVDISNSISLHNGHPTFESISNRVDVLIADLVRELK